MTARVITPWTVRGSRHVHRDRWVSLRADDCVSDEGTEFAPYYVLEYGLLLISPVHLKTSLPRLRFLQDSELLH